MSLSFRVVELGGSAGYSVKRYQKDGTEWKLARDQLTKKSGALSKVAEEVLIEAARDQDRGVVFRNETRSSSINEVLAERWVKDRELIRSAQAKHSELPCFMVTDAWDHECTLTSDGGGSGKSLKHLAPPCSITELESLKVDLGIGSDKIAVVKRIHEKSVPQKNQGNTSALLNHIMKMITVTV